MALDRIVADVRTGAWQQEPARPAADHAGPGLPSGLPSRRTALPPPTITCPTTGPERAAYFTALRQKAAQRVAELG